MKLLPDVYHAPASRYIGDTGHVGMELFPEDDDYRAMGRFRTAFSWS
ncbi:MAG: hypothetical protein QGF67_06655 [Lentisphaeria bacterium]|jgi:hypothetical protein|nr:hypothetical protein [Lentisphaeria bacterium]MDP7741100.1 hypothetical protein [Lentisphaeria bacterium]